MVGGKNELVLVSLRGGGDSGMRRSWEVAQRRARWVEEALQTYLTVSNFILGVTGLQKIEAGCWSASILHALLWL